VVKFLGFGECGLRISHNARQLRSRRRGLHGEIGVAEGGGRRQPPMDSIGILPFSCGPVWMVGKATNPPTVEIILHIRRALTPLKSKRAEGDWLLSLGLGFSAFRIRIDMQALNNRHFFPPFLEKAGVNVRVFRGDVFDRQVVLDNGAFHIYPLLWTNEMKLCRTQYSCNGQKYCQTSVLRCLSSL